MFLNTNKWNDNKQRIVRWLSWLFSLVFFCFIIVHVYKSGTLYFTHYFALSIVMPWLVITLLARLLMVEVFVRPIRALSYSMPWPSAFWLGWLRTFFNQVIPMSGITLIAAYCKKQCGLAWGEIAALSSPLYLVSLAVTGAFATAAIFLYGLIGGTLSVLPAAVSLLVTVIALVFIFEGSIGLAILPRSVRSRLGPLEQSLRLFEGHGRLMIRLSVCYSGIILLRCLRLWLLFALSTNLHLGMQEVVLLAMISEFGFLVPLIPGGIGVREGALVSVAWLLGLNIEIVAAVAVMDRLFTICLVAIMAMPAYFVLRREIVAVT